MKRPFGVTVLALIHFIEAVLFLLTAGMLYLTAQLVAEVGADVLQPQDEMSAQVMPLLLEFIQSDKLTVVYAVIVALALVFVVVGVGLWRLRPWARGLTLALMALRLIFLLPGLIFSVVQFSLFNLIAHGLFVLLYAWIVWYLFQPEVKQAFSTT